LRDTGKRAVGLLFVWLEKEHHGQVHQTGERVCNVSAPEEDGIRRASTECRGDVHDDQPGDASICSGRGEQAHNAVEEEFSPEIPHLEPPKSRIIWVLQAAKRSATRSNHVADMMQEVQESEDVHAW